MSENLSKHLSITAKTKDDEYKVTISGSDPGEMEIYYWDEGNDEYPADWVPIPVYEASSWSDAIRSRDLLRALLAEAMRQLISSGE